MQARGFNLIEVMVAMAVMAIVTLSLATGVGTSASGARTLENRSLEEERGQMFLERLTAVPFGASTTDACGPGDLSELFDADEVFGVATLHSLRKFGAAEFVLKDAHLPGKWRIVVDRDLNGDGDEADEEEGRNDLLRCAIYYDGRLLDQVIRFDPKGEV